MVFIAKPPEIPEHLAAGDAEFVGDAVAGVVGVVFEKTDDGDAARDGEGVGAADLFFAADGEGTPEAGGCEAAPGVPVDGGLG